MKGLARLVVVAALALPGRRARRHEGARKSAKKEGELTWYTAHYTSRARELGADFSKTFGIKVNVVRTTAQVAYQRLLQDLKNNQIICDVSRRPSRHYVRLAADGRFEKYTPEAESKSFRRSRTSILRAYYHATFGRPGGAHLHTSKVSGGGGPRSGPICSTSSGRARSRPAIRVLGYVAPGC